jgi:hypothetical protein
MQILSQVMMIDDYKKTLKAKDLFHLNHCHHSSREANPFASVTPPRLFLKIAESSFSAKSGYR